jgi:hypothetical protein
MNLLRGAKALWHDSLQETSGSQRRTPGTLERIR